MVSLDLLISVIMMSLNVKQFIQTKNQFYKEFDKTLMKFELGN